MMANACSLETTETPLGDSRMNLPCHMGCGGHRPRVEKQRRCAELPELLHLLLPAVLCLAQLQQAQARLPLLPAGEVSGGHKPRLEKRRRCAELPEQLHLLLLGLAQLQQQRLQAHDWSLLPPASGISERTGCWKIPAPLQCWPPPPTPQ